MFSGILIVLLCVSQVFSPASPGLLSAAGDQAIAWELSAEMDPEGLNALLSPASPVYDSLPPQLKAPLMSPQDKDALETLQSALAALRVRLLTLRYKATLSLGTDQHDLAAFHAWADPTTGSNGLVSDLLRQVFVLPNASARQFLAAAESLTEFDPAALMAPYLELVFSQLEGMLRNATPAKEQISFQGYDGLNHLGSLRFTSHMAADIIMALHAKASQDPALADAITKVYNLARLTGAEADSDPVAEFLADLEAVAAQLRAQEARPLFDLDAYREPKGGLLFVLDSAAIPGADRWECMEIFLSDAETAVTLVTLEAPAEPATGLPDWEDLRRGGRHAEPAMNLPYNYVSANLRPEAQAGETLATINLMLAEGVNPPVKLSLQHYKPNEPGLLSDSLVSIHLMDNDPLARISLTARLAEQRPVMPDTAGWPVSGANQSLQLSDALTAMLPGKLFGRFYWAFPQADEAGGVNAEQIFEALEALITP